MKSILIWIFGLQDLIDVARKVVEKYNQSNVTIKDLKFPIEQLKKELENYD
jgi:precorrin-2 methylase